MVLVVTVEHPNNGYYWVKLICPLFRDVLCMEVYFILQPWVYWDIIIQATTSLCMINVNNYYEVECTF